MSIEQIYIAITRADGGVSIMGFVTVGRGSVLPSDAEWIPGRPGWWRRSPTDAAIFYEVSRSTPDATGYHRINKADIPADRAYRDALAHDGVKLHHHMPKAREIHLDKLRRHRAIALEDLDKQWMRATAADDKHAAKAIEAKRQALRDMPTTKRPHIEAASTVDELANIKLDD
jgi:hypothetical protein